MILQDGSVIVENSQSGPWLDMEVVGCSWVVVVMDDGREEQGKDLQVW